MAGKLTVDNSIDQRLWIVIDEFDALGPIDGLKDALARIATNWRPLRAGLSVDR